MHHFFMTLKKTKPSTPIKTGRGGRENLGFPTFFSKNKNKNKKNDLKKQK